MKTISIRHYWKVWSLDRLQKLKSPNTLGNHTNSIDNKIVFQAIGLWFYFMVYSREDRYKSRYFIKKDKVDIKKENKDIKILKDKL